MISNSNEMIEAIRNVLYFYDKLQLFHGAVKLFQEFFAFYDTSRQIFSGIPKPRRGREQAKLDRIT